MGRSPNRAQKTHQMRDILLITKCAVICGADNWSEIEESSNWDKASCFCLNPVGAPLVGALREQLWRPNLDAIALALRSRNSHPKKDRRRRMATASLRTAHISTAHNPSKTAKKHLQNQGHKSKKKEITSTWIDLDRLRSTWLDLTCPKPGQMHRSGTKPPYAA